MNENINPRVILLPETIKLADVPDNVYFSKEYAEFTSNSRLGLINPEQQGSPEKYKEGFDNGFNPSFILGDAIHKLILQPNDYFLVETLYKPTGKIGLVADIIYEEYSKSEDYDQAVKIGIVKGDYYKGKLSEKNISKVSEACKEYVFNKSNIDIPKDKEGIFLDVRSIETVKTCVDNVDKDSTLQKYLKDEGIFSTINSCEECVTADFKVILGKKEVIIKFKGKVDHYTFLDDYILQVNDLKSTGRQVEDFGNHSFYNYHYYRQMSIYTWLLSTYYKSRFKKIQIENPKMLVVSTIPPNDCGIFEVNKDHIQKGLFEFKELMSRVAVCTLYGFETQVIEDYLTGSFDKDLLS